MINLALLVELVLVKTCVYIYFYIYVYVHIWIYEHVPSRDLGAAGRVHIGAEIYVHIYTCTYIYTNVYTYIYIYLYMYIYMNTRAVVSLALLVGFVLVLAEKFHTYTLWETICSEAFHEDGRLQVCHMKYQLNIPNEYSSCRLKFTSNIVEFHTCILWKLFALTPFSIRMAIFRWFTWNTKSIFQINIHFVAWNFHQKIVWNFIQILFGKRCKPRPYMSMAIFRFLT